MLASGGRAVMRSSPRLRAGASLPRAVSAQAAASPGPAAGPRGATTVRVATYNVLSSALAAPSHFTACRPEDLAASARLPRVLAKLEAEVDRDAVICLQEVSLTWAGARCHCLQIGALALTTLVAGASLQGRCLPGSRSGATPSSRTSTATRTTTTWVRARSRSDLLFAGANKPSRLPAPACASPLAPAALWRRRWHRISKQQVRG